MKLIQLTIIIGIIFLIILNCSYKNNEQFIDINNIMILFTTINDTIIKSYNIVSFYSIYGYELEKIFNDNEIIRVNVPLNYSLTLRYAFNNDLTTIGKIIELSNGKYEIYKFTSDKIINQIDIKNMIGYNNNLLAVTNVGIPYYWDTDMNNSFRPEYNSGVTF
jgi:hypothetical protein